MDNFQTKQVESDSDLSMDNFHTENRDASLQKRNRDGDYDFILTYFSEEEAEPEPKEPEEEEEAAEPEEEEEEEKEKAKRYRFRLREGRIALEIFSVKINRPGSVSGRIYANNWTSLSVQVIYDNKRNDNEELQYNVTEECGDLLLSGPDAIIETYDTTFVFVDLVHKMINSSSEVEEHPITNSSSEVEEHPELKGIPYDNFHMHMWNEVDKPLIKRLVSDDGKLTATMYTTLFSKAAEAIVEVKLLDESRSFGVYGSIKASTNMFSDPNFRSILFLKDRNDSVLVERGQPIQLSRSMVAVPCRHNLIICVNLTSEDAYLPSARITFPVKCSSESVKKINSQIQVKVTWKTNSYVCEEDLEDLAAESPSSS